MDPTEHSTQSREANINATRYEYKTLLIERVMVHMWLTYEYIHVKENIDTLYIEYLLLNFSVDMPSLLHNTIMTLPPVHWLLYRPTSCSTFVKSDNHPLLLWESRCDFNTTLYFAWSLVCAEYCTGSCLVPRWSSARQSSNRKKGTPGQSWCSGVRRFDLYSSCYKRALPLYNLSWTSTLTVSLPGLATTIT